MANGNQEQEAKSATDRWDHWLIRMATILVLATFVGWLFSWMIAGDDAGASWTIAFTLGLSAVFLWLFNGAPDEKVDGMFAFAYLLAGGALALVLSERIYQSTVIE